MSGTIRALAFCVTAVGSLVQAQQSSPATSVAQPQELDRLRPQWDKPDSPGCAVAVLRDGKLLYERHFGRANLDYDIPITQKSVFPIASLAKQFTAACVALLADEAALSLDDDIRRYLPEMPDYGRPITVRHLIHHTSGMRDYGNELLPLTGMGPDEALSDDDVLQLLARQKNLNFPPGDVYRYSNSGYFLLGVIVKRVTGLSLRAFAHKRLFEPLGMTNTHFHDDPTQIVKDRVIGYFTSDGKSFQMRNPTNRWGDGGVMTTLHDLVTWEQAAAEDRLGNPGFSERLLTRGKLTSGEAVPYAFGLNHGEYRGRKTVWHTGSFPGFRTALLRFPERRFAVIVLSNVGGPKGMNAYQMAQRVADLFLGDWLSVDPGRAESKREPEFIKLSAKDLEDKRGTFLDPDGAPWVVATKDGALQVTIGVFDPPTTSAGALTATRFRLSGDSRLEFEFAVREAEPRAVRVYPDVGKPFWLKNVELVSPTPQALGDYVGTYFSAELQSTYRVVLRDGRLFLVTRNTPESVMGATVRDTFKARRRNGNLQIVFERDAGGSVRGFVLSQAGGVRDVRFVRKAD